MYDGKNVKELKALCKERKITGYSKLRREGLIDALEREDEQVVSQLKAPVVKDSLTALVAQQEAGKTREKLRQAKVKVKGRSVGATTMAMKQLEAADTADTASKLASGVWLDADAKRQARNKAKRKRQAIRARGGQA